MMKRQGKNTKCMDLDYSDEYRAMTDYDNPYSYNFGRAKRIHSHTEAFMRLQNRVNIDYFSRR